MSSMTVAAGVTWPASGRNLGVLWEGGEGRKAEAGKETEEGREDKQKCPEKQ